MQTSFKTCAAMISSRLVNSTCFLRIVYKKEVVITKNKSKITIDDLNTRQTELHKRKSEEIFHFPLFCMSPSPLHFSFFSFRDLKIRQAFNFVDFASACSPLALSDSMRNRKIPYTLSLVHESALDFFPRRFNTHRKYLMGCPQMLLISFTSDLASCNS